MSHLLLRIPLTSRHTPLRAFPVLLMMGVRNQEAGGWQEFGLGPEGSRWRGAAWRGWQGFLTGPGGRCFRTDGHVLSVPTAARCLILEEYIPRLQWLPESSGGTTPCPCSQRAPWRILINNGPHTEPCSCTMTSPVTRMTQPQCAWGLYDGSHSAERT